MEPAELATVAFLAIRGQRFGLALAPQARWHDLYGRQMARLEFPGVPHVTGAAPSAEALALGFATYGRAASLLPTCWTYGPSPRHAVDRFPAAPDATAPFLRFERTTGKPPRLVAFEVYRAALAESAAALDPQMLAALVWLPLAALRHLVSGARLGDLLAMDAVIIECAQSERLPEEALVYLPSDYGERHLLRIVAKYGESALFATAPTEQA